MGSTKENLIELPPDVKRTFGHGLRQAQEGGRHENSKPLKGFGGSKVIELIDRDEAGTYRAVYTIGIGDIVFVLHVFQKKSKHGIATPNQEIMLIKSRLKRAQEIYKERYYHEKKV